MSIDFGAEADEITGKLKQAQGYLDCEKVVVSHIKKQLENGNTQESITLYLKKLSTHLEAKMPNSPVNPDGINYRYATGFVATLLKMPYWESWIKTLDM